ncbi:MAG TPA: YCF48-related protein [Candidatus Binatia bacterium]|nr:YCF48-related protein [Candidatus Binatia bacterium]
MKKSHSIGGVIIAGLLLVGAGCISFNSGPSTNAASDGGVFKTANKGDQWAQKTAIPTTTGEKRSISNANVSFILQDPGDPNAIYIGTSDNGMFYSYDGGESWMQPAQLNRGRVPSIAVDSKDKCTIYVAVENKLLKSDDCSRTWNTTYLDSRLDKLTSAVAVDFYNPKILWVANNAGDLLKSTDAGVSWTPVKSFQNAIMKVAMNAADSRHVYVATKTNGVWRSDDGGGTWADMSEAYKDFSGSKEYYDLAIGVSDPDTLVLASKYGLIRSTDGGNKWDAIDLLTPAGTTLIYSVAVDPKDANSLYYGTSTTFYRSPNGGANWVPKKLPSTRAATALLVDRTNPNILYLGMTRFKQ